jgi:hypothetical protein
MTSIKILNALGLIFDFGGALLMFFNAKPKLNEPALSKDEFTESGNWIMFQKKIEQRKIQWVWAGMGLLAVGFLLQLIAALRD